MSIWQQLLQLPLVSFVVIAVHLVINHILDFMVILASTYIDLVFHMTEKAFLRCIIPGIRFA